MLQERFIWMMRRNGVLHINQGVHGDVTAILEDGVSLEHNSDPVDEVELCIDDKRYLIRSDELVKEIMQLFKNGGRKSEYEEFAKRISK